MCKQKLSVSSATEEKDLNDTEQNFLVHSTDSTANDRYTQIIYLKENRYFSIHAREKYKDDPATVVRYESYISLYWQ